MNGNEFSPQENPNYSEPHAEKARNLTGEIIVLKGALLEIYSRTHGQEINHRIARRALDEVENSAVTQEALLRYNKAKGPTECRELQRSYLSQGKKSVVGLPPTTVRKCSPRAR